MRAPLRPALCSDSAPQNGWALLQGPGQTRFGEVGRDHSHQSHSRKKIPSVDEASASLSITGPEVHEETSAVSQVWGHSENVEMPGLPSLCTQK